MMFNLFILNKIMLFFPLWTGFVMSEPMFASMKASSVPVMTSDCTVRGGAGNRSLENHVAV